MISTNTKRLSIERLYSSAHPVRNSPRVLSARDREQEPREPEGERDVEHHPEGGLLRGGGDVRAPAHDQQVADQDQQQDDEGDGFEPDGNVHGGLSEGVGQRPKVSSPPPMAVTLPEPPAGLVMTIA